MKWLHFVYGGDDGLSCFYFKLTFFSDMPIFMLELKLHKSRSFSEIQSTAEIWRLDLLCYGKTTLGWTYWLTRGTIGHYHSRRIC